MAHLRAIKGGEPVRLGLADYIWLDSQGDILTKRLTIAVGRDEKGDPVPLLERVTFQEATNPDCTSRGACSYPGYRSSVVTNGTPTTCTTPCSWTPRILVPAHYAPDPTQTQPAYIVICEVRDTQDVVLPSCQRAALREAFDARGEQARLTWFGLGQPYWLNDWDDDPLLGQRQFEAAQIHMGACLDAGLLLHSGSNAGGSDLSDFKIGPRGLPEDLDPYPPTALVSTDHLIIARYLLHKIGHTRSLGVTWEVPVVYVSTAAMREPASMSAHKAVVDNLTDALATLGEVMPLPHPARGGFRCLEVCLNTARDPYTLALKVLTTLWPTDGE